MALSKTTSEHILNNGEAGYFHVLLHAYLDAFLAISFLNCLNDARGFSVFGERLNLTVKMMDEFRFFRTRVVLDEAQQSPDFFLCDTLLKELSHQTYLDLQ